MGEIMFKENIIINNMREGNISRKRGSHHGVGRKYSWKLKNGITKRDKWRKGWINNWINVWRNPC